MRNKYVTMCEALRTVFGISLAILALADFILGRWMVILKL